MRCFNFSKRCLIPNKASSVSEPEMENNSSKLLKRRLEKRQVVNRKLCIPMKFIFLVLLIALQASAGSYAQTVTIKKKKTKLENIFNEIQKQTGYEFFYADGLLKNANLVDIDVKGATIKEVLDICFKDQPIAYIIIDKVIKVVLKDNKQQDDTSGASTEYIRVTGKVVNEEGEPLPGVTVQVVGRKITTFTDMNGIFKMSGVKKNFIIRFTYVGRLAEERKVINDQHLSILLRKDSATNLSTHFSTGYSHVLKINATGSFQKVDESKLDRVTSAGILQRLEGMTNGMLFSWQPGFAEELIIQIRNRSTINSDSRPLIVVDNFPYAGDINNINPNDVESITILRDAAASSIWGARSGNGVIVIRTKRSKYNQKENISVSTNVTIGAKPDLFYIPTMSSTDFIGIEEKLFDRGYYDDQLNNSLSYPVISPVVDLLNKKRMGLLPAAEADAQIASLKKYDIRNDYNKYLFRNSLVQQYAINYSGSSSRAHYYAFAGFDKAQGAQVGQQRYKINFNTKVGVKVTNNLEVQAGFFYTQNQWKHNSVLNQLQPGSGGKASYYPYARLINENGNHLALPKKYGSGFTDTAGAGSLLDWKFRPLDEMNLADNTTGNTDIMVDVTAKYKWGKGLNTEIKYLNQKTLGTGYNYYDVRTFTTRNFINEFTPYGEPYSKSRIPYGGIRDQSNSEMKAEALRIQLNGNFPWRGGHEITTITGGEIRRVSTSLNANTYYGYNPSSLAYTRMDYQDPSVTYFGFPDIVPDNGFLSSKVDKFASLYFNGSYSYNQTYILTASARRDASNIYGVNTNNKWKILWSAGASWNIANEKFYRLNFLNELKIRGSIGKSGNSNNSVAGILTIQQWREAIGSTAAPIYVVNNPPNPDLRWESVLTKNIAVDFASHKKIINGSIEVYWKKCTDLLGPMIADPTSGYYTVQVNGNELKVKGIDIQLSTKVIDRVFKLTTEFLISANSNRVTKLLSGEPTASDLVGKSGSLIPKINRDVFSVYSYKWAGLDPLTGHPQGMLGNRITQNWDSILRFSTPGDLVYHGSSIPRAYGSLRNTMAWKRLTMSLNFIYRFDYYFRRKDMINYTALIENWELRGYKDFQARWQKPGDELVTSVPSMVFPASVSRDNFYGLSSIGIQRADNIRIQDMSISYLVDKRLWPKLPFKSIAVSVYSSNIGIIWKANTVGLDPDFETPPPFNIGFGLKADL